MATLIVDFPPQQRLQPHDPPSDQACYPNMTPMHNISKKGEHVRFAPTSMLHVYDHPQAQQDASSAAIYSPWHSHDDELQFKMRARREILLFRLMKSKMGGDLSKICSRSGEGGLDHDATPFGLEQQLISREYTKRRVVTKRLVALAVLTEQARPAPRENGDERWERIAAASRRHSQWSRTQAKTIGTIQALSI